MKSILSFRSIWKINAVIILIAGSGVCLTLAYAAYESVASRLAITHRSEMVNVNRNVPSGWQLGSFESIPGVGVLAAPVYSEQTFSFRYSEKEAKAIRNYLFVNVKDKSSRWLIPDNKRLVLTMTQFDAEGDRIGWGGSQKTTKWLVFEVGDSDTNGDGRLTDSDRKILAIADADGSRYVEVVKDIESLLGSKVLKDGRLLVFYFAKGRNLVSEIDMENRRPTIVRELPELSR